MTRYQDKNRTAYITGAANGIGEAIARRLVAEGANVFLTDIDETKLSNLCEELGPNAAFAICDTSKETDVTKSIKISLERYGRIDIGVLCAGIEGRVAILGEMTTFDFEKVIDVNLKGVFFALSRLMPIMKEAGGGSIVILSSTGGLRGALGSSAYVASKHAVVGLMRCAALEGGPYNVRVNTVNPGPIDTRMLRALAKQRSPGNARKALREKENAVPLKRNGRPDEVAKLISFLASDESSYCTGNVYPVDGGIMAGRGG